MIRVKVCGLRRRQDVDAAVELGASALGFILWPQSPRAVTPQEVRQLTADLPAFVGRVGVFVNQAPADVRQAAEAAGLTAVQLHGDEDPALYRGSRLPIVKAYGVGETFDPASVGGAPADVTVLLDAHDPIRRGGTGRVIDWTRAAGAARLRPIILSGGLTPDNVGEAVQAVRPFAVDVSSGVEREPGIKDEQKLRAFFAAVQA